MTTLQIARANYYESALHNRNMEDLESKRIAETKRANKRSEEIRLKELSESKRTHKENEEIGRKQASASKTNANANLKNAKTKAKEAKTAAFKAKSDDKIGRYNAKTQRTKVKNEYKIDLKQVKIALKEYGLHKWTAKQTVALKKIDQKFVDKRLQLYARELLIKHEGLSLQKLLIKVQERANEIKAYDSETKRLSALGDIAFKKASIKIQADSNDIKRAQQKLDKYAIEVNSLNKALDRSSNKKIAELGKEAKEYVANINYLLGTKKIKSDKAIAKARNKITKTLGKLKLLSDQIINDENVKAKDRATAAKLVDTLVDASTDVLGSVLGIIDFG